MPCEESAQVQGARGGLERVGGGGWGQEAEGRAGRVGHGRAAIRKKGFELKLRSECPTDEDRFVSAGLPPGQQSRKAPVGRQTPPANRLPCS